MRLWCGLSVATLVLTEERDVGAHHGKDCIGRSRQVRRDDISVGPGSLCPASVQMHWLLGCYAWQKTETMVRTMVSTALGAAGRHSRRK